MFYKINQKKFQRNVLNIFNDLQNTALYSPKKKYL